MEKLIQDDGLAYSKLLIGDNKILCKPTDRRINHKITWAGECRHIAPRAATREGRNLAKACRSIRSDAKAFDRVRIIAEQKYCPNCRTMFRRAFLKEMNQVEEIHG